MPDVPTGRSGDQAIKVCILGSVAAGKTCFLAGLAVLNEPHRESSIEVHARGRSKQFLDELASTFGRQEWPAATNTFELLEFTVLLNGRMVELSIMDFPGEDFTESLRRMDPATNERFLSHFLNAHVLLLLVDPAIDILPLASSRGSDQTAILRQDAILQAVREHVINNATKGRNDPQYDIGIVLTKCDLYPEIVEIGASRYFKKHANVLYNKLAQHATGTWMKVFAISAVGTTETAADGRRVPPTTLTPVGFESIFEWVMAYRSRRKNKKLFQNAATAVAFVFSIAVLGCVVLFTWLNHYRGVLRDESKTAKVRLEQTTDVPRLAVPLVTPNVVEERGEVFDEQLAELEEGIKVAVGDDKINSIIAELEHLATLNPGTRVKRVDELLNKARQRRDDFQAIRIKDLFTSSSPSFRDEADRYLSRTQFPDGQNARDVREMLKVLLTREMAADRRELARLGVSTRGTLENKAERISRFVEKYGSQLGQIERIRMLRAVELASMCLEPRNYTIRLLRSGDLTTAARHQVTLSVRGETKAFVSQQSATRINWSDTDWCRMKWRIGDPITVDLETIGWFYNTKIAHVDVEEGIPMFELARFLLAVQCSEWAIGEISNEDVMIYREFLFPGYSWK